MHRRLKEVIGEFLRSILSICASSKVAEESEMTLFPT